MKNSPANGSGTPREEGPSMGDYGLPGYGQENVGWSSQTQIFYFNCIQFLYEKSYLPISLRVLTQILKKI